MRVRAREQVEVRGVGQPLPLRAGAVEHETRLPDLVPTLPVLCYDLVEPAPQRGAQETHGLPMRLLVQERRHYRGDLQISTRLPSSGATASIVERRPCTRRLSSRRA